MAALPGKVNLDYLVEMTGGDPQLAAEIIDMFIDHVPPEIDTALNALQNEDFEQAKKIIHKIKPNYIYLGLQDWHGRLKEAEDQLNAKEWHNDYLGLIQELQTATQEIIAELEVKKNELGK